MNQRGGEKVGNGPGFPPRPAPPRGGKNRNDQAPKKKKKNCTSWDGQGAGGTEWGKGVKKKSGHLANEMKMTKAGGHSVFSARKSLAKKKKRRTNNDFAGV